MLSDVRKIDCIKEPVCSLNTCVNPVANLLTYSCPVHTINNLIDLIANDSTQCFPVSAFKSLFQLVSELTYTVINGKFLKHRAVVSTTTATAACIIILLHDDVQFVNASSSIPDFLCRLCSRPASFRQGVTVRHSVLLRSRKHGSARKTGEQHIDVVQ